MVFRVFIAIVLFGCAYFAFDIVRFSMMQNRLLTSEDEYVLVHPENHDITLVKFLDYNCGYCKDAHPVVMDALARDGRAEYIPRPVDFIQTDGILLSRLPYAAAKQGQFFEMHEALINNYRSVDEAVLQDIAADLALDYAQLMRDYADKDVIKRSRENHKLHKAFKLNGTPAYAIGTQVLFSPVDKIPDANDFVAIFNDVRANR